MTPSDSIIITGAGVIITIIGSAFAIGKKVGNTTQKINNFENNLKKVDDRLTYIERIFMGNAPKVADRLIDRFLKGEKQEE